MGIHAALLYVYYTQFKPLNCHILYLKSTFTYCYQYSSSRKIQLHHPLNTSTLLLLFNYSIKLNHKEMKSEKILKNHLHNHTNMEKANMIKTLLISSPIITIFVFESISSNDCKF